jgi:beta-lactam-binding protein with PASTA domain
LLGLAFVLLLGMMLAALLLAPPAKVRVPQLGGRTRAAVTETLHRLHLRSAFTSRFDSARAGRAIAQSPSPAARVTEGSTVRVTLSAGPPPVEVPRLVGQSASSARSVLASLGLNVHVTSVPSPGTAPGTITGQSPQPGRYLRPHGRVSLDAAETPQWRSLTSFGGTDGGQSVPFRIRGTRWRVAYHMSFVGTCTLVFFCDGPSAQIVRAGSGATVGEFGMNDGGEQTQVVPSGPGLYQVRITPGSDTTRWSLQIADYY